MNEATDVFVAIHYTVNVIRQVRNVSVSLRLIFDDAATGEVSKRLAADFNNAIVHHLPVVFCFFKSIKFGPFFPPVVAESVESVRDGSGVIKVGAVPSDVVRRPTRRVCGKRIQGFFQVC